MKKLAAVFILTILLALTLNAQDEKPFTIQGNIVGKTTGQLYLRYAYKNKTKTDSAELKDGKFVFRGLLNQPTTAELFDNAKAAAPTYKNFYSDFYIEPATMNVSLYNNSFSKARLTGSKTNDDYQYLNVPLNPVLKKIADAEEKLKTDSLQQLLSDSLLLYNAAAKQILVAFIQSHPKSFIAVKAAQRFSWFQDVSPDSCISLLNALSDSVQKFELAQSLKSSLIAEITSSKGQPASDFTRKDLNGNVVQLSAFKGHYVLLDFWASWCEPCRALTPHIKALYAKYHIKGLNIIAVSCDSQYEAWQQAIHHDGLDSLTNILSFTASDMAFLKKNNDDFRKASFKVELRKQFNVWPIPVAILIDSNGVIVGRYGGDDKQPLELMDDELANIFGDN